MFNSPFNSSENKIAIPEDCDIIFVSDMFTSDYPGGAEMTTDALIDASNMNVFRLHSQDVTMDLLSDGFKKYWIFGNFSSLDFDLIPTIVTNIKYSVLEYDYKYCRYRSPEKHQYAEQTPCNCHNEPHGKYVSTFFYGAQSLWWMSQKQMERYHTYFPFLGERDNVVLSSVFDDKFFATINALREKYKDTDKKGWVVVGSNSWIKGVAESAKWCAENNHEFEIVHGVSHDELLEKLAQSEGMCFLPLGGDTCPRTVLEAKLLGCKLHLNENVQHKDELWFDTEDMFDTEAYLYAARERFWNGIKYHMEYSPTISGYTTTLNCIDQNYPFEASIRSMLGFCDQVVVVDGGSSDGTWERLQELSRDEERLLVHKEERDWNSTRFAVYDGQQKAVARSLCTMDWCWQQDSDEVVHQSDYEKISTLLRNIHKDINLLALPVIEYWGRNGKTRIDVTPWKWRVSRNLPNITHGIPGSLVKEDENGEIYALPGTDGCDYIDVDTREPIKFASFYTQDIHNLRVAALTGDGSARDEYQKWFQEVIGNCPSIHHYSWFDLTRKINTYKNYWSQHWQSLYNIEQEDTVENNMFFDKKWSEVTDSDIEVLATRLEKEMGGWVFHTKVNFLTPTPELGINVTHPEEIGEWISSTLKEDSE